jgi:hypothetical protein
VPLIEFNRVMKRECGSAGRDGRGGAACLAAMALIGALASQVARAEQWSVEKAGVDLYRITGQTAGGQSAFVRIEGCADAPPAGVVDVRKDGDVHRFTFSSARGSCAVRDFLVPVNVRMDQYGVLLTQDQSAGWYRVTDGDLYLKTVGCISRATSESAMMDLNRDGTGWLRFKDGRRCAVEHAFRSFQP